MKIENLRDDDNDIASCLDIYNYYIENTCSTLEEEKLSLKSFKDRVKNITSKYPFIVLKSDEGEVLGYAYLNTFNPRSAYRITADLSIYIDYRYTKSHLGGLLLKAIEGKSKEYGISNIISIVTGCNKASSKFHEKNGFVLEGELKDVAIKFGEKLGVYYYRKAI